MDEQVFYEIANKIGNMENQFEGVSNRLSEILREVKKTNGKVNDHETRLSILEDRKVGSTDRRMQLLKMAGLVGTIIAASFGGGALT